MTLAFTILFILNCFFLVLVVLLQAGRGGGLSFAGASAGSATVFGASGGATFLQKLTVASAVGFMVLSLVLARLSSSHSGVSEGMFIDPDAEAGIEAPAATGEPATSAAPEAAAPEAAAPAAAEAVAPIEPAAPAAEETE